MQEEFAGHLGFIWRYVYGVAKGMGELIYGINIRLNKGLLRANCVYKHKFHEFPGRENFVLSREMRDVQISFYNNIDI